MNDNEVRVKPDPPPYPHDWGSEKRLRAYWFAVHRDCFPAYTKGWYGVLEAALRLAGHGNDIAAQQSLDE